MYKVLSEFIEGNHHYKKNDDYPFSDEVEVDQERAEYLADAKANGRVAFIEKVAAAAAEQSEEPVIAEPDEEPTGDLRDIDSFKVEELREFLDKEEVSYDPKAKKPELLALAKEKIGLPE
ncbi:hypothetical protein [Enterococcus pallens]|uniref:HeH/LEM domain-containing protein n=1 Tax=Enterococcus pallens ATCC BAA-351 TaxID=1158607 RepID=R2T3M7_9ENTE|nr:hypothetical protein [Enterococcus pallens]EOH94839.1 hypothetical protein UAU_01761 [Enterococcus pallens ATCC BAA-351]EOU14842.1 hypothetical protein I588_04492 [Enterococcus pallens ATCC BAA-351]OJG76218.1 hypothetical protein RV10_GL004125 [Enterococcus pallens]